MASYASVVEGRREGERERKAKSKRERKKRKEREGRGTTTVFILEKGFGLAFCHPLLTSVQPFSGKFSNVCHPLRPFLLHGQCLSTVHHDNRTGIVTVLPSLEIHAESTGCIHPATFSSICLFASPLPLSTGSNCNRVRFHGQRRVLLLFRLCSLRVTKTFFLFFFFLSSSFFF